MTFMETMKEGSADEIFEKLFPIVGAVIGVYMVALLVVWFAVDFGAMLAMLFVTAVLIVIIFLAVLVTGCVAEGISNMIITLRE